MLSIGIIWNSAHQFVDEIIHDINSRVKIIYFFSINLIDKYPEFVFSIYSDENMERYKIEKKLQHMSLVPNTNVTIVLFEFNNSIIEFHPFKKKYVYTELEKLKKYIREKYKEYIENYTFDIIFHATDNLEELKTCYKTMMPYLEEFLEKNNKSNILVKVKNNFKQVVENVE